MDSCDLHNGAKSKEDEIFAHFIATACNGNELALTVVDATLRAWKERPYLRKTFMKNERECWTPEHGHTGAYQIDRDRLDASVKAMTKAIYFKHSKFKEKLLTDDMDLLWEPLRFASDLEAPYAGATKTLNKHFGPMQNGTNPRVFQYDFHTSQHKGQPLYFARFKFFEGHPLFVYWPASLLSEQPEQ